MADWKTASLADVLPDGTSDIITSIQSLLTIVTTPLDLVSSTLTAASTFLTNFPLFDLMKTLRESLEKYKTDFTLTGMYLCPMLDYPLKQLQSKASFGAEIDPVTGELKYQSEFSPEIDYTKLAFNGQTFNSSFVADLANSFDDLYDTKRPMFKGDVAMLVIVMGGSTINNLDLDLGENNIGNVFGGLSATTGNMIAQMERLRKMHDLGVAREVAEKSSKDVGIVATRVRRVVKAKQVLGQLDNSVFGGINVPFDIAAGHYHFDNVNPTELDWEVDIVPVLETVEEQITLSQYPDWSKFSMREFLPEIVEIVDLIFDPIIDMLKSGENFLQQILDLIATIKAKIKRLQDIIYQIDNILNKFDIILNSIGFHALYLTASNGVDELKTKLENAGSVPFTGTGFYSGFSLLTGGPQVTAFKLLLGPVGS